jgi:predicted aminopeptidase
LPSDHPSLDRALQSRAAALLAVTTLRFAERREDLDVEQLGIIEQAHHADGWFDDPLVASMWPMEADLIVKALRDKRAEIHGRITAYEAQIE